MMTRQNRRVTRDALECANEYGQRARLLSGEHRGAEIAAFERYVTRSRWSIEAKRALWEQFYRAFEALND